MAFLGGGFFGSGASSSESSSNAFETGQQVADRSMAQALALNIGGGKRTSMYGDITMTDHGAIAAGQQIAAASLVHSAESLGAAVELARDAVYSQEEIASLALDLGRDTVDVGERIADSGFSLAKNAMTEISDAFYHFTHQAAQGVDRQLAFARAANTSENLQLLEGGLRFGAIALAIVAAAFVFRGGIKFK